MYTKETTWAPLITDPGQVSEIRSHIDQIADKLKERYEEGTLSDSYNLFTGKSGIALFFYEYSQLSEDESFLELSNELLSSCIEQIEKIPVQSQYYTFCGGLTGFATALDFFKEQELIDDSATDILGNNFTSLQKRQARLYLNKKEYDYLHGAIGIMLYLTSKGVDISDLVRQLVSFAIDKGDAIEWHVMVPYGIDMEGINFSLSHGMASILYFFTYYVEMTGDQEYVPVIEKIVQTFLNYENRPLVKTTTMFPSYIILEDDSRSIRDSRMGWCYGDLGFGTILYKAATVLKREDWKIKAISTLEWNTDRRQQTYTKIMDPCFCHGAVGVAHIYNRMYAREQNPALEEAAQYWYNQSLSFYRSKGLDGYRAWKAEDYGGPQLLTGLLDGVTGIGLSYIHAITEKEPYWDKILLLS
jgi:lantibiotic modifying enzyme